jgi:uncharacterized protein (DUF1330 family)
MACSAAIFAKFGGRFIVRGGQFQSMEGMSRTRNVVVEFPDYQAALDCYHSPEYRECMKVRQAQAVADIILVEGYDER